MNDFVDKLGRRKHPSWVKRNPLRLELIRKRADGTITEAEGRELEALEAEVSKSIAGALAEPIRELEGKLAQVQQEAVGHDHSVGH
ncbi:MAG: hypothetical protein WC773_02305 [Patescibacteria group bacterium]|jgi:hypothetical protein